MYKITIVMDEGVSIEVEYGKDKDKLSKLESIDRSNFVSISKAIRMADLELRRLVRQSKQPVSEDIIVNVSEGGRHNG